MVCALASHLLTRVCLHQLNAKISYASHRPTCLCPHLRDPRNETIAIGDLLTHQYDLMIFYHS